MNIPKQDIVIIVIINFPHNNGGFFVSATIRPECREPLEYLTGPHLKKKRDAGASKVHRAIRPNITVVVASTHPFGWFRRDYDVYDLVTLVVT